MKRFAVVLLFFPLLVGVLATPSMARPNELEAEATAVFVEELEPGVSWFRGDVLHVRGVVWSIRVEGSGHNAEYLTGNQVSTFNFNWNYKTGALNTWATFEISLDGFDGGYAGSAIIAGPPNPDAVGGQCAAFPKYSAVARGFGELEGAQARIEAESNTCGFVSEYDLTLFFPGR